MERERIKIAGIKIKLKKLAKSIEIIRLADVSWLPKDINEGNTTFPVELREVVSGRRVPGIVGGRKTFLYFPNSVLVICIHYNLGLNHLGMSFPI